LQRVPISKYARMHKKSIFEVVKEIQRGKLQCEEIEENGTVKRYILLSNEAVKTPNKKEENKNIDLSLIYRELQRLSKEVAMLREELKSYRS